MTKTFKLLALKTRLDFGKYKGEKVMTVCKDDPGYLLFLHEAYHPIKLTQDALVTAEAMVRRIKDKNISKGSATFTLTTKS